MMRYLLCPQCGAHRYYLDDVRGSRRYVQFDWDGNPVPPDIDASAEAWSAVACCGCSWRGSVRKLVKYYSG